MSPKGIPFRIFKGPLFYKPVTCQELVCCFVQQTGSLSLDDESTPEITIITQVVQQVSGGLGIGSFCTQTKYNTIQSENIGVHPREYISFYANFISQINRNHMFHAKHEKHGKLKPKLQCLMYQPINLFLQIHILMDTEISHDLYIIIP